MSAVIFPVLLLLGAFLAAFLPVLAVIGTVQATRKRPMGFMVLVPYGIIITSALIIAYSGRDLSSMISAAAVAKPGLLTWAQRIFTLGMLLAAMERLASCLLGTRERSIHTPLAICFGAYWICSALLPMFLGKHSQFSHETFYTLIIGLAALTLATTEVNQLIIATRNGILLLILASWIAIPLAPKMVIDFSYNQGYLPNVPRFAGFSVHAVALGMLVQIGMFFLWLKPFKNRPINLLAWLLLALSLFLSQAKAAWISTLISGMLLLQFSGNSRTNIQRITRSSPLAGILLIAVSTTSLVAIVIFLAFKSQGISNFLASAEGSQLASLTGRDVIWSAALDEWKKYPLFGFGTELFSLEHRMNLGLPNATHAHNQVIDILARSGLVGTIAFIVYIFTLGYQSYIHRQKTKGLSLVLFLALFIRGISEIPFNLSGYGHEFLTQFLLLAVLSSAHREVQKESVRSVEFRAPKSQFGPLA